MPFQPFPQEEFKQRLENVQAELTRSDLDALLLTAKENVIYFSGLQTSGWHSKHRPLGLIIPKEARPALVVPEAWESMVEETTWISDVHLWGGWREKRAVRDPIQGIVEVIEGMGLSHGTIGMEFGTEMYLAMSQRDFFRLKDGLAHAELVDAADLIWRIRMIKSAWEVETIKVACDATCKAFEVAFQNIKAGMTERELAGMMFEVMVKHTNHLPGFAVIRSGKVKYKMMNVPPFDKKMEKGDMVLVDAGAKFNDYWCDMMRMANIGGSSDEQRQFFEVIRASQQAGSQVIKPGIKAREIFDACKDVIDQMGFGKYIPGLERVGHSVGLDIHEPLSLAAGSDFELKPGMVLTVEPIFSDHPDYQIGNFGIEDMILVTETGHEILTDFSRDLQIAR